MLRDTRHFSAFGTLSPDFLKIILALLFHSKVEDLRMPFSFNVPQLPDSQKRFTENQFIRASVNFCAKMTSLLKEKESCSCKLHRTEVAKYESEV